MRPLVLLTSGTRGDVQPVIALALGLRAAGRAVKIVAPPAFGEWIVSFGIPFASVEGNPSELLLGPGGQSALTFDGNPLRSLAASFDFLRRARPIYARMLASAFEACRDASALLVGLPSLWGTHLAEALDLPCGGVFTQPVTPTGEFPSPLLPATLNLGSIYNRLTYQIASQATFLPWRGVINTWRKRQGLKPLPGFDFHARLELLLYGFSPQVVPPPADWPASVRITGYWPLAEAHPPQIPEPLRDFLAAKPLPLYFTFGSPGARQTERMLDMLTAAVQQAGQRAILSLPNDFSSPKLPSLIFPLSSPVSHAWLFPQLSGVIHHGGAGTTGAGLRAGLPTLVMPLAVDQFFWGQRVAALGVGPPPIPQRDLTVGRLVAALEALQNDQMRAKARVLGGRLKDEGGVEAAVKVICQW